MFNYCNVIFLLYFIHFAESFIASTVGFNYNKVNLDPKTFDNHALLHVFSKKMRHTTKLNYKEYNDNDPIDSRVDKRFEVRGVSVSPIGFLVLLSANDFSETPSASKKNNMESTINSPKRQKGQRKYDNINNDERTTIFIRVSNDKADEMHCSSPEALTIVQLLSGVDMAGAVLPPQLLQHLVALHCSVFDDVNDDDAYILMRNAVSKVLKDTSYFEATQWQLNQIRYPKVVLKDVKLSLPSSSDHDSETFLNSLRQWHMDGKSSSSITMSPLPMKFQLEGSVDGFPISIPLFSEQLPDSNIYFQNSEYLHKATYSYTPASAAFIAISLALRYHTSISISSSTLSLLRSYNPPCTTFGTSSQLNQCLPQWKSVSSLINQSNGVMQNVQTCFQANQLQGALRIALEKGDDIAAQKIQERLKQFDNFDDLPVVKGMDYTDKGGVLGKENDSWA